LDCKEKLLEFDIRVISQTAAGRFQMGLGFGRKFCSSQEASSQQTNTPITAMESRGSSSMPGSLVVLKRRREFFGPSTVPLEMPLRYPAKKPCFSSEHDQRQTRKDAPRHGG
jgi:hypothetical protein